MEGIICQRWPTTSLLPHLFPQGFSRSILFQRKILLESVLIFLKSYTCESLPWLLRTTSDILKTKWNKNQRKDVDLGLLPEGFRFIRIRGELGSLFQNEDDTRTGALVILRHIRADGPATRCGTCLEMRIKRPRFA